MVGHSYARKRFCVVPTALPCPRLYAARAHDVGSDEVACWAASQRTALGRVHPTIKVSRGSRTVFVVPHTRGAEKVMDELL